MGTIRYASGRITLISDFADMHPSVSEGPTELCIVPWTDRVYLVEPERLLSFCNAVNSGELDSPGATGGRYYLRAEGATTKVRSAPKVPSKYSKYILSRPVTTIVAKLRNEDSKIAIPAYANPVSGREATVNVGWADGIWPGMCLYSTERSVDIEAFVISSTAKSARILVTSFFPDDRKKLHTGSRLSTRNVNYPRQPHP
jgi:hypothetical protein